MTPKYRNPFSLENPLSWVLDIWEYLQSEIWEAAKDLGRTMDKDPTALLPTRLDKTELSNWELGSGYFGTVFRTGIEGMAFKITSDPDESRLINYLLYNTDNKDRKNWNKNLVGLSRYYGLYDIDIKGKASGKPTVPDILLPLSTRRTEGNRTVSLIWREKAGSIGLPQSLTDDEYETINDHLARLLHSARDIAKMLPYRMVKEESVQSRLKIYKDTIDGLTSIPMFRAIGKTLHYLFKKKILLADVRDENIGKVVRKGEPLFVIIDPGYAVFLDTGRKTKVKSLLDLR